MSESAPKISDDAPAWTLTVGQLRAIIAEVAVAQCRHESPALLTAAQVAEHFNVDESWVREQGRRGILPSVQLGHYVRFSRDAVEKFIVENGKKRVG